MRARERIVRIQEAVMLDTLLCRNIISLGTDVLQLFFLQYLKDVRPSHMHDFLLRMYSYLVVVSP